jgi:hypothetical protein
MLIRDTECRRSVFLRFRSQSERSDAGEIYCRQSDRARQAVGACAKRSEATLLEAEWGRGARGWRLKPLGCPHSGLEKRLTANLSLIQSAPVFGVWVRGFGCRQYGESGFSFLLCLLSCRLESAAGKTPVHSLAAELCRRLGLQILDGDEIRGGLCSDLGFSLHDRAKNVRRVAHLATLLALSDDIVLVALISPLRSLREMVLARLPGMLEIFVDAPFAVCEQRDPKGLYKKARAGMLSNFTV